MAQVEEKLNLALDWYRYNDSHYIVRTTKTVGEWYVRLEEFVTPDGSVFISQFVYEDCNGWMAKDFWDWLEAADKKT